MPEKKKKIMLSIMKEIDGGTEPKAKDYDLSQAEFGGIVKMCQESGYITGAGFSEGGRGNPVLVTFLKGARVTEKGYEYLEENSALMKVYHGLKEIRDWLLH